MKMKEKRRKKKVGEEIEEEEKRGTRRFASSDGRRRWCLQMAREQPHPKPDLSHSHCDGDGFVCSINIVDELKAGGAVLAATLGASSYSYGPWAKKKAIKKLKSNLLQQLQENPGDHVSSPDIPVYPDMGDGDPSSVDGDGGPDTGDGGFDTNIDDPKTADKNPRDFNQQDLKKAIKVKLNQKGRRITNWAIGRRVARADLPGRGPVYIRKYRVEEMSELPLLVQGVRALSRTVIHVNVARLLGISTRERSLIYKQFSERTLHDSLRNC